MNKWYDYSMHNDKGFGLVTMIVLIGLLALGGFWYFGDKNNQKEETSIEQTQNTESTTTPITGQEATTPSTQTTTLPKTTTITPKKTTTNTSVNESIDYGQAVNLYANVRIQFNANCQASPSSMILKNGSKIMLDNRSEIARPIMVDGIRYDLAAYGFRIVTVSSKTLPHIVSIDCGYNQNSAQINLQ